MLYQEVIQPEITSHYKNTMARHQEKEATENQISCKRQKLKDI
jgi:hypothetical protein